MSELRRRTIQVRAPRDIIEELRVKYPNTKDSELIRMTYNTSLLRAEMGLERIDFKNKMGKFLYGTNLWDKTISNKNTGRRGVVGRK